MMVHTITLDVLEVDLNKLGDLPKIKPFYIKMSIHILAKLVSAKIPDLSRMISLKITHLFSQDSKRLNPTILQLLD